MLEERDFIISVVRQHASEEMRDGKLWYAAGLRTVSISEADESFVTDLVAGLHLPEQNVVLSDLDRSLAKSEPEAPVEDDQRIATRKRKPFYIAFSVNGEAYVPAYGLDISRTGICIVTDPRMPEDLFKVRVILKERDFVVVVKKMWDRITTLQKGDSWITGTKFTQIDPVDREFVDCYANDKPFYSGNKLLEALERLKAEPDRADLWLPQELLASFLRHLVRLKRLAPLSDQAYPLVRYRYEGTMRRGDEVNHVLFVESRVVVDGSTRHFATRFAFDETGADQGVL